MIRHPRDRRDWIAAATLLALLATGPAARAQAQVTPPAQNGDDELIDDGPVAPRPPQPTFVVNEANFDAWIFGGRNVGLARAKFETMVTLEIDEVERTSPLTKAQRARLRLAARGDVKRLFDRIDVERRKFRLVMTDQVKFNQFYQEFQPLIVEFQKGPFGDRSLFAKTLKMVLDETQAEARDEAVRERKRFQEQASADHALALLDVAAGLSEAQRQRLAVLIRAETRPPKRSGYYDFYVVLLQLAKLPEAKFKPIFNESQWTLLRTQFDYARRIEPYLSKNGFLPDDPPAPAPAPKAADARK